MSRKIVCTVSSFTAGQKESIREAAERLGFVCEFYGSAEAALQAVGDAEIILGDTPILTQAAPKLRWIFTPSAGINQFGAPDAFASPDAVLSNSSGAYGVTISEHIVMVTLELMRRQPEYNAIVADRSWIRDLSVRSIHGSRILLLGTGDIGRETAKRLRAFGPASIRGVNRSGRHPGSEFDEVFPLARLDEFLPETDLLILSLPGTPETKGLLSAARLAKLPDGAIVVNVGRGTVIDQSALEAELRAERLQAALDVFEEEPIPEGSDLWTCPNLLITPHIAGNMSLPYTVEKVAEFFLEDLERYARSEPLKHQASRAKGY